MILLTKNILVIYILCFIFGMCIAGRYTVGYVLLVENMPRAYRIQIGLLVDITEAAAVILITVYLSLISKNWIWF